MKKENTWIIKKGELGFLFKITKPCMIDKLLSGGG